MNKARRCRIRTLLALLEEVQVELEAVSDEEQEAFDNLPENLSCSSRAESMEEILGSLDSAVDSLVDAVSFLEEALEE